MRISSFLPLVLFIALIFSCEKPPAGKGNTATNSQTDPYDNYTDWAIYRGDKKSNQYSELAQINATNVHKLEPVWEYHTGDPNGPSMYSNPIIVRGADVFYNAKAGRNSP